MLPNQIKNFREMVTLKDGSYVLLRAMTTEDKQRLIDFYSTVHDEDLRFFRHPVKDPAIIQEWCDHLDYNKVLPLLALANDRLVGNASLYFFVGPKRHIGEVRLFLGKDHRQCGLGLKMLRALIDLARKRGISILIAEVVAEMTREVKAFEQQGFKQQTLLSDYFMFPDGETSDVILMTMTLRPKTNQF